MSSARAHATPNKACEATRGTFIVGFGLGGSACMGSIVLRIIHDDRLGVADAARATAGLAGASDLLAFGPALDVPRQARSSAVAAFFEGRELQDHGNLRTSRRMQRRWRCTWIRAWRVGVHGLNRSAENLTRHRGGFGPPVRQLAKPPGDGSSLTDHRPNAVGSFHSCYLPLCFVPGQGWHPKARGPLRSLRRFGRRRTREWIRPGSAPQFRFNSYPSTPGASLPAFDGLASGVMSARHPRQIHMPTPFSSWPMSWRHSSSIGSMT